MIAERQVTICNKRGLHARASAKFVAEADRFDASVSVSRDGEQVRADSIMDLLMLAAGPGVQITIHADGGDAQEALDTLCALVECGFNEDE